MEPPSRGKQALITSGEGESNGQVRELAREDRLTLSFAFLESPPAVQTLRATLRFHCVCPPWTQLFLLSVSFFEMPARA